jgi:hypothetical protein
MRPTRSKFVIALSIGTPATLIIIGMLAIAGCIYIPVPEHPRTRDEREIDKLVGPIQSGKPIRAGFTTRDMALGILGKPDLRTTHDLAFAYRLSAIAGHRFGLCVADEAQMIPATDRVDYYLALEFDREGVLLRYHLKRSRDGDDGWRDFQAQIWSEDPNE